MQKRVCKEYLVDYLSTELLEKNNNMNKNYVKEIENLVTDLFDLNKLSIYPLDEEQTLIIRKYFGIFDDGIRISSIDIAKIYNVTPQSIMVKINRSLQQIYRCILKSNKDKKMSSVEINSIHKNKLIKDLNLDYYTNSILSKNSINTIEELLMYSIVELQSMGLIDLDNLINEIHKRNLKFIDELNSQERRSIIFKNNLNTILNSSLFWAKNKNSKFLLKIYECYNLKNLLDFQDLLNNIYVDKNIRRTLKINLDEIGLNFIETENNKEWDLSKLTIDELYINNLIYMGDYKILKMNNVNRIKELNYNYIQECFKNKKDTFNRFLLRMSKLNIYFEDEPKSLTKMLRKD